MLDPVDENEHASREAERIAWMAVSASLLFCAGAAVGGVLMLWLLPAY